MYILFFISQMHFIYHNKMCLTIMDWHGYQLYTHMHTHTCAHIYICMYTHTLFPQLHLYGKFRSLPKVKYVGYFYVDM